MYYAKGVRIQTLISELRNKNCRLRFDFSMISKSVTVIRPGEAVPAPSRAKFFRSSHPIAPQPT